MRKARPEGQHYFKDQAIIWKHKFYQWQKINIPIPMPTPRHFKTKNDEFFIIK